MGFVMEVSIEWENFAKIICKRWNLDSVVP
jgi:hypothetical protein